MTPLILDTARHASPLAPFGGLLFAVVVKTIYRRTRTARAWLVDCFKREGRR